jgi:xylose isomerase
MTKSKRAGQSRPETLFPELERVPYLGPDTDEPLAYRWYDPERMVAGRRMEDQLRPAVCYWHTLCWPGGDMFGDGVFDRPWLRPGGDRMAQARAKLDAGFEIIVKLGVPFFCFHDRDLAPEGGSIGETTANLERMVDATAEKMDATGVRLLWGTANLFSHPRYAAGAATSPDPEAFAYAAYQVREAMRATQRLGGSGYVLWGGREGYDTLLNTDLKRELDQLARFLHLVVEHKHRIGFDGMLMVEPKPHEPTKHQYDHDCAAVHAFLLRHGLEGEIRLNIEVNHATLAGHSFHHEVAYALAHDLFGSVDANRGDPQNGWDTDQFPNDVGEWTLVLYEILKAGGIGRGGFNFDAKLRRQSLDPLDLLHAHVGGLDTLAEALVRAARLIEEGGLSRFVEERYARWGGGLGRDILDGRLDLEALATLASERELDPRPRSGRQELLENVLRNCRPG